MAYCGYVTTLKNVRKHPNADRLLLGECFGNVVCVSTDYAEGEIGVYFPTDGQLSVEFAEQNNLLRKKDENGNNIGGYMDPDKRNVTSIKLRGEKSDGIFLPISCLEYTGVDMDLLDVGVTITDVNGHHICEKYIPKRKTQGTRDKVNKTRKKRVPIAPLFAEHADTEQLAYNMGVFKAGDEIEITLKMHGTSQRTGYLPKLQGYKRTFFDKIFRREGTPVYDWGYVTGTRRVVLNDFDGAGYYDTNNFREGPAKAFEGKLHKGETVYYEVVGYTDTGAPIMGDCNNRKVNDKDFIKQYGETTRFSYGMDEGFCDFYVYRMTMTNEDGDVVEYTPYFMRYRCEQMGVKCVPVLATARVFEDRVVELDGKHESWFAYPEEDENLGNCVRHLAEEYYDGPDPIGKTHIREGVVVRIINRPSFTAYKHKNWYFKALECIVKVDATAPDMEEAQEIQEDGE